jgi:hypothetical protein
MKGPRSPPLEALAKLPARQAYLDGELCGVRRDGTTSFSLIQNASDTGNSGALVFFLFDLLHLDGEIESISLQRRVNGEPGSEPASLADEPHRRAFIRKLSLLTRPFQNEATRKHPIGLSGVGRNGPAAIGSLQSEDRSAISDCP